MNRQSDVTELDGSGNTAYHRYAISYDDASLLLGDTVVTRPGGTAQTQVSTYSYQGINDWNVTTHRYNLTGGYQEGQVTDVKVATTVGSTVTNSETQYGYGIGTADQIRPGAIYYFATASTTAPMTTSYGYKMDTVSAIDIEDGKPRTVTFTDDAMGDILGRQLALVRHRRRQRPQQRRHPHRRHDHPRPQQGRERQQLQHPQRERSSTARILVLGLQNLTTQTFGEYFQYLQDGGKPVK